MTSLIGGAATGLFGNVMSFHGFNGVIPNLNMTNFGNYSNVNFGFPQPIFRENNDTPLPTEEKIPLLTE